jgi:hypothetical protein
MTLFNSTTIFATCGFGVTIAGVWLIRRIHGRVDRSTRDDPKWAEDLKEYPEMFEFCAWRSKWCHTLDTFEHALWWGACGSGAWFTFCLLRSFRPEWRADEIVLAMFGGLVILCFGWTAVTELIELVPSPSELWRWIRSHKALVALIVVLLAMVPAVQRYELVDSQGRGTNFYKAQACKDLDDSLKGTACDLAVEMMFGEQFAWTGFSGDKQPLIPGLFHREKLYRFHWNHADFNHKYQGQYSVGQRYRELYNIKK